MSFPRMHASDGQPDLFQLDGVKRTVKDFNDARAIGMPPAQAARWAAECARHREQGTSGIGLDEAYLQWRAALSRAEKPHPQAPGCGNGRIKKR